MKLKKSIIVSEFNGSYVAVAAEGAAKIFNGMITLNETAAFIVSLLNNETNEEDIAKRLLEKYDVTEEKALTDIKSIVEKFRVLNLIEE